MTTFDERANNLLSDVWRDLQNRRRRHELEQVKADPDKHRMTRIMTAGASYTYWPASIRRLSKKREDRIWFCVAKHRNAAGNFLMWRQVDRHKLIKGRWSWFETERFDFQWSTSKRELRDLADRKAKRDKLDWAHECAAKLPAAPPEAQAMLAAAIG